MNRAVVVAIVALLGQPALAEPAKAPKRLLVYTLKAPDAWAPLARDISEGIVVRLAEPAKEKSITVLSEGDVAVMANYIAERADLSEEDCKKAEVCLSKLSQSAESEFLLSGSITRAGDSYIGVLYLLDAIKAERVATKSCVAGSQEEFRRLMIEAASEILGISAGTIEKAPLAPLPAYGQKIAVIPITGLEDDPGISALSDLLSIELAKYEYSALTKGDLILLLKSAREWSALNPAERSFDDIVVELAGAYGADYLATGHIAKFDQSYVLVLKLIHVSETKVVRRIAELYRGPKDYLPAALKYATARLFERESSGGKRRSRDRHRRQR